MNLKNYNQLSIKQKILFNIGIFSLSSLIIFLSIDYPAIKKINENKINILNQKIELEKRINREKNINKLKEKLNTVEPELEKFNKIFINENRQLEFITSIENLASKNNVTQKFELPPASTQSGKGYKKIPITIYAQGSLSDIINYLTDLESFNYYININSLDMGINSQGYSESTISSNNISLKINANTYWQ